MSLIKFLYQTVRKIKHNNKASKLYDASTSTDELSSLNDESLFNTVNSALYFDFDEKETDKLNPSQRTVLALISFDSEIQNGGLCQFFVNSSSVFAAYVSQALRSVGAEKIKRLYDCFISENNINVTDLQSFKIERIEDFEAQTERYPFDDFDNSYYEIYEEENLTALITTFVRKNLDSVFEK